MSNKGLKPKQTGFFKKKNVFLSFILSVHISDIAGTVHKVKQERRHFCKICEKKNLDKDVCTQADTKTMCPWNAYSHKHTHLSVPT